MVALGSSLGQLLSRTSSLRRQVDEQTELSRRGSSPIKSKKSWRGARGQKVAPALLLRAKKNHALLFRDALTKDYNVELEKADFYPAGVSVPVCNGSTGELMEFVPIEPNGSCGFEAIAVALSVEKGKTTTGNYVRTKLRDELRSFAGTYDAEAADWCVGRAHPGGCSAVDLADSVMRRGKDGHWLGERWGNIELLALARALHVCIELFVYDEEASADAPTVRNYETFDHGKVRVGLLYSGLSQGGHFDVVLLGTSPSR
mmetsp:Transcript_14770/g.31672  ORF Transcript_14770/g.31672 Transcript_14770/m.31672 type:complete len:259 (+) Transcript_14770:53-829(+)